MTSAMRIPADVHSEVSRLAAVQSVKPGDLLAKAWAEFLERHRNEMAADLEQMAEIIRNGATEDLAEYVSRNAAERGAQAAKRARGV